MDSGRGRGAHDALDALAYVIERRKVSWIVDCDIRKYLECASYCPPVATEATTTAQRWCFFKMLVH